MELRKKVQLPRKRLPQKKQSLKIRKEVSLSLRMIKNPTQQLLLVLPQKKKMKDKLQLTNSPQIPQRLKLLHHQRKKILLPQQVEVAQNQIKRLIRAMKRAKLKQPLRQCLVVRVDQCQCLVVRVDQCQRLVVRVDQCQRLVVRVGKCR